MCGVGLTTRTQESLTRDECRPECEDGHQLDLDGVCVPCPMGEYRSKGVHPGKENNHLLSEMDFLDYLIETKLKQK